MSEPLFFAATALSQNAATIKKIDTNPAVIERNQRVQAEKERLDRILVSLRKNVTPEVSSTTNEFSTNIRKPTSGAELFTQRTAILANSKGGSPQVHTGQHPTYQQWRSLLVQEANRVKNQPVGVMLGDSLSLWFPSDRLPPNRVWLNQSISGDTTGGILKRLSSFAHTRPQIVYLMAGVNDLKNGASDQTILQNLSQIIQQLRRTHPQTQVVVQSVLPTRVLPISSNRIIHLNRQLQAIARQNGAYYLDIHSQMTDSAGYLRPELTTDGLHLNANGYEVWRSALSEADTYISRR